jgi:hypothetical protein
MKAILWGYQYNDMKASWCKQMTWLSNALINNGIEVKKHEPLICTGLENLPLYDIKTDCPSDICIYNHADISHLRGNILESKVNWFFKPTVPDAYHTTLDELGYGPFSTVGYEKPNFENTSNDVVKNFFDTQVKGWIDNCNLKWGTLYNFCKEEIPYENYVLVLGQCYKDEVVTRHEFGNYFNKLYAVINELHGITNDIIVVKLHPFTDGLTDRTDISLESKQTLEKIGSRVKVFTGKSNIHNFIEKAKYVVLANSSAGFEVMMHHKPMITWGRPEYHWITGNLFHLANLQRLINLDWFNKDLSDKFLYWYMEKYCFYNQETANFRVKELLDKEYKNARL